MEKIYSPFYKDKYFESPIRPVNLKRSQDFLTINKEKSITTNDSYSMLTEKKLKNNISVITNDNISIKSSKFITLCNKHGKKLPLLHPNSIRKLPKISTQQILTEADYLVKERRKHEGLMPNYLSSSIAIKKSKDINLKNYIINRIKEKREEIENNQKKRVEQLKVKQSIYEKNYRNYLNTVEENQKKQKEEEKELNILKYNLGKKEKILIREKNENKKLEEDLKKIIKLIMTYKKYGSFVNKVFGHNFIYDEINDFDGKDYYKLMYEFIDIYEKNKKFNSINEKDFMDMLLFQGEDILFLQYKLRQDKIIKILDKKNILDEEIKNENIDNKNEIKILSKLKNEREIDNLKIDRNKKEQNLLLNDFKEYDISETKKYMKYIIELGETLGLDNIPNVDTTNISDCVYFCKNTLNELEKKEIYINKSIEMIDNIFKSGDNDEKYLISYIINDRKKYNKKIKQEEIKKNQEDARVRINLEIIDRANKIFVKGRKIAQDYPLFKNKKKKIKENLKDKENEYEYLYYSSDEN